MIRLDVYKRQLYTRTERELEPATFRVNGDTVDIMAAFGEFGSQCFRVMFSDNEIEAIQTIDPVPGQRIHSLDNLTLYPTSLFVTTKERINGAVQQIYLCLLYTSRSPNRTAPKDSLPVPLRSYVGNGTKTDFSSRS